MNQKQDYHSEMSGSPISVCGNGGNMALWDRKTFFNECQIFVWKLCIQVKGGIGADREQGIEVIYVQHDDGPDTGFSIGDDEFEVYSEFQPMPDEKRFIKSVCSAFKKESGLLEYLTAKEEKDVMICGIMTDFCINATVEAGFEHGLHMIVPAYANSTQDNEYMTREQAYHYYNEFLWPERYADCVPMDRALELLKK